MNAKKYILQNLPDVLTDIFTARPDISQFQSLKSRGSMNLLKLRDADRRFRDFIKIIKVRSGILRCPLIERFIKEVL